MSRRQDKAQGKAIEIYDDFKKLYGRTPSSTEIQQILLDTFNIKKDDRLIRKWVNKYYPSSYDEKTQEQHTKWMKQRFDIETMRQTLKDIIKKEYEYIDTNVQVRCKFPCKWLLVDDEHIPFLDIDSFKQIIEQEKGADGILVSEILDRQEFSIFPKRSYVNPVECDKQTGNFIAYLESKFKYGVILTGNNHWMRLAKWISRLPNPEQVEILNYLTNGGLPKFTEKVKKFQIIRSFVCQIGMAVYCHPEDYLSNPLRTAMRMSEWLRNQGDLYNITTYDSCWTGHTHKLSCDYSSHKILMAEVGCTCYQEPYTITGRMRYGAKNRWTLGYGVLYLDKDGKTDYNKSGVKFIGYAKLPK
jgi:hypothetical protein